MYIHIYNGWGVGCIGWVGIGWWYGWDGIVFALYILNTTPDGYAWDNSSHKFGTDTCRGVQLRGTRRITRCLLSVWLPWNKLLSVWLQWLTRIRRPPHCTHKSPPEYPHETPHSRSCMTHAIHTTRLRTLNDHMWPLIMYEITELHDVIPTILSKITPFTWKILRVSRCVHHKM